MLEVVGLSCERDDRVLFNNLSFSLSPGETVQIEGCNGSGKTTLLKILAGLTQDWQGAVFWRQQPVHRVATEFRLATCFIGHGSGIKQALSPLENLIWRQAICGRVPLRRYQRVLADIGLGGHEHRVCSGLSAGQQRRVALAALQLSEAALWLLDEPFTAMDSEGVAWIERQLARHARQGGMTVMTSHQPLSAPLAGLSRLVLDPCGELPK